MPLPVLLVLAGGVSTAGVVGTYQLTHAPAEAIGKNVIPLAIVAAGTFLALRYLQKAGKAA